MERVIGGIERRVLAVYGRSLTWFLRHRWISAGHLGLSAWWARCGCSSMVPKAFLPLGDSGFIWGVMIAQEGSSPEQMHALQDRADDGPARQSRRGHDLHHDRQRPVHLLQPGHAAGVSQRSPTSARRSQRPAAS